MGAPNYHNEHAQTGSASHDRLGHTGKYYAMKIVNDTQTDFTGSNYGYGAVIVAGGSATGTITLSGGGGEIDISKLTQSTLYEFSVGKVVSSNAKDIYVFKKRGM